jgi:hypothetical protein
MRLQIELTELEKRILELDRKDEGSGTAYRLRSIEHHEEWDSEHKELSEHFLAKLQVYGKFPS